MRISLFKKTQTALAEPPAHVIPQLLAQQIIEHMSVKAFSDERGRLIAIQLRTNETLTEIKQRFAPVKSSDAKILPVRDWRECLILSYPIADQRSNPAY